jgi:hypothetical protein
MRLLRQGTPDQVYLAAAKVGGIHANNTYPAEFIYQNLMIEANIIHGAWRARRAEAALPRQQLHLPQTRAAADGGRRTAHRYPGTDQRSLRHRQDRRHQALRELQPPVRHRLPQRHADQPLRPGRQLRPAEQPRHPGDDPQAAPGQDSPPNTTGRRSKATKPGNGAIPEDLKRQFHDTCTGQLAPV